MHGRLTTPHATALSDVSTVRDCDGGINRPWPGQDFHPCKRSGAECLKGRDDEGEAAGALSHHCCHKETKGAQTGIAACPSSFSLCSFWLFLSPLRMPSSCVLANAPAHQHLQIRASNSHAEQALPLVQAIALADSINFRKHGASSTNDLGDDDSGGEEDVRPPKQARVAASHAVVHGEELATGRFQDPAFFVPDAPGSIKDEEAYAVGKYGVCCRCLDLAGLVPIAHFSHFVVKVRSALSIVLPDLEHAARRSGALDAAVMDIAGEDSEQISSMRGNYHWDKRQKKYVRLQAGEQASAAVVF